MLAFQPLQLQVYLQLQQQLRYDWLKRSHLRRVGNLELASAHLRKYIAVIDVRVVEQFVNVDFLLF